MRSPDGEEGLASTVALQHASITILFVSLDTTTMQDARCLSWHCLDMSVFLSAEAKDYLLTGAFVCRHKAGSWNAISANQFGEQMAIKIGKGGLKGITLSSTQVAKWIDFFPMAAYVSDTLDHCYSPDLSSSPTETPHKEDGVKRCKVDEDDRQRISTELGKNSHPLDTESGVLCNIHNGKWLQRRSMCRFLGTW